MLKETRQLFKHLLTCGRVPWGGVGEMFQTKLEGHYGWVHITVDNRGGFEVRKSTPESQQILIDKPGSSEGGLRGYQDKKDKELVQKLYKQAKDWSIDIYAADVAKIVDRAR